MEPALTRLSGKKDMGILTLSRNVLWHPVNNLVSFYPSRSDVEDNVERYPPRLSLKA